MNLNEKDGTGLKFDNTINLSNVLAFLIMAGAMAGVWIKIETSLATYEAQIQYMNYSIDEIKEEKRWYRRNHYRPPQDMKWESIPPQYHNQPSRPTQ